MPDCTRHTFFQQAKESDPCGYGKRGISGSEKALALLRGRIGYAVAVARSAEPEITASDSHFTRNRKSGCIFVTAGGMQRKIVHLAKQCERPKEQQHPWAFDDAASRMFLGTSLRQRSTLSALPKGRKNKNPFLWEGKAREGSFPPLKSALTIQSRMQKAEGHPPAFCIESFLFIPLPAPHRAAAWARPGFPVQGLQ